MKKKLLTAAALAFSAFLLIPYLSVTFAGSAGMAICFLLFFAADPLVCAIIGAMAGTQPRQLWWMPIAAAAAMPLCFCLCVQEFVPELFIYAGFYLMIGLACMGAAMALKTLQEKRNDRIRL